jgi:DNA transformation protein
MSTQASTMDYLLDQLRHAGPVSSRKMFGEYCLYYDGAPVGLVCDDQLFLKPTDAGRALMREVREGAPFPGARPHLLITADDWDDAQALCLLVRSTALALPPRKVPKPRAPRKVLKTLKPDPKS